MSTLTKPFKIIYYIFVAFIILTAVLLVFSAFPMTKYKFLIVRSGSMAPAIKLGSIVMAKPAAEYKIGDVITFGPFNETKTPITHRIYDIKVADGKISYITKGDANNGPDQQELSKRDIIGKVLFSLPYLGYVIDFAKKPLGFALIIIIPATIIIFDEVRKIFGEIKKMRQKEQKVL